MRISPILAVAVLGAAITLTACGSDSGGDDELSATGEFGDKPEITVPSGDPSEELVVELLSEGDGAEVASGDFLLVNYLGQTWVPRDPADVPAEEPPEDTGEDGAEPTENAEPTAEATEDSGGGPQPYIFDNSYDRGEPAGFYVGVGGLIPGWDEGLVGQQVGSRLLLSIPPDQGYGTQEGHDLAEDTLVFVVDIIDAYNIDTPISGEPVSDLPDDMPTITGEGAEEPTVEFSAAAEPVSESTTDLVVAGDGDDLGASLVVKALEVSYDTGENGYSSWTEGGVTVINVEQIPGLAEALDGQKEGSRVVARISAADNPTEQNPGGEPIVIVIDVVGSY